MKPIGLIIVIDNESISVDSVGQIGDHEFHVSTNHDTSDIHFAISMHLAVFEKEYNALKDAFNYE